MRRSRTFCPRESNFDFFVWFLVYEGREVPLLAGHEGSTLKLAGQFYDFSGDPDQYC